MVSLATLCTSAISLVTPGSGTLPGVVGIVTIRSLDIRLFAIADVRSLAYPSALMVGVYEEIARLNVFSVDPGEWSPAAWKGRKLAIPTPIHHIRGSPWGVVIPLLSNSCNTGFTHFDHSQDRNS